MGEGKKTKLIQIPLVLDFSNRESAFQNVASQTRNSKWIQS